ncbi:unnamed protein product [Urochloa humidicola]
MPLLPRSIGCSAPCAGLLVGVSAGDVGGRGGCGMRGGSSGSEALLGVVGLVLAASPCHQQHRSYSVLVPSLATGRCSSWSCCGLCASRLLPAICTVPVFHTAPFDAVVV